MMLRNFIKVICVVLFLISNVDCHILGDKIYVNELKKMCEHAYMCFHDTVIVCGKSVNEARTFLDLCDLYEYSCELNMGNVICKAGLWPMDQGGHQQTFLGNARSAVDEFVLRKHVKDDETCPNAKELAGGVG